MEKIKASGRKYKRMFLWPWSGKILCKQNAKSANQIRKYWREFWEHDRVDDTKSVSVPT